MHFETTRRVRARGHSVDRRRLSIRALADARRVRRRRRRAGHVPSRIPLLAHVSAWKRLPSMAVHNLPQRVPALARASAPMVELDSSEVDALAIGSYSLRRRHRTVRRHVSRGSTSGRPSTSRWRKVPEPFRSTLDHRRRRRSVVRIGRRNSRRSDRNGSVAAVPRPPADAGAFTQLRGRRGAASTSALLSESSRMPAHPLRRASGPAASKCAGGPPDVSPLSVRRVSATMSGASDAATEQ